MELFYLNEHTSCYNYSKSMQEGFRYYKFDEGLNHEEELVKDCTQGKSAILLQRFSVHCFIRRDGLFLP